MVRRRILIGMQKETKYKPRDVQGNERGRNSDRISDECLRVMKRDEVTGINEGNNGKD